MTKRHCRTCAFWAKPATKKALAGKHYPCTAPIPETINLPECITANWSFQQALKDMRSAMERDHGANCPAWEVMW